MKKTWSLLAMVLIVGLLMSACTTPPFFATPQGALATDAPAEPTTAPPVEKIAPTVEAPMVAEPDPLGGTSWRWVSMQMMDGSELSVPNPENYLLGFAPEGMLALKADCNTVGGSYIVDGQSITIMLGPTTMAFCGEESLDQMYLAALSQAATFEIDEDALVIGLAGNAGSMAFATVAAEESAPEAAPAVPAAAAEPISPAGLQNVLWQWDRFTGATKADTYEVPNPEQYQLAFLADGVFAVHADCNRGRGVYLTGADGSMALDVTLLTRAMCGPMSLEGRFLELLDKVTAYVLTEGNLYMDLTTADGVMHLSAGGAAITGNVTYLDRKALPPDAIVKVTLNDISRADAPQVVLGEQVIAANGGQPPFPFAVSYDPSVIVENHTYGMRARIEDSTGKLLYTSDTVTPVITRGNPVSDVEIVVVPVQ